MGSSVCAIVSSLTSAPFMNMMASCMAFTWHPSSMHLYTASLHSVTWLQPQSHHQGQLPCGPAVIRHYKNNFLACASIQLCSRRQWASAMCVFLPHVCVYTVLQTCRQQDLHKLGNRPHNTFAASYKIPDRNVGVLKQVKQSGQSATLQHLLQSMRLSCYEGQAYCGALPCCCV